MMFATQRAGLHQNPVLGCDEVVAQRLIRTEFGDGPAGNDVDSVVVPKGQELEAELGHLSMEQLPHSSMLHRLGPETGPSLVFSLVGFHVGSDIARQRKPAFLGK